MGSSKRHQYCLNHSRIYCWISKTHILEVYTVISVLLPTSSLSLRPISFTSAICIFTFIVPPNHKEHYRNMLCSQNLMKQSNKAAREVLYLDMWARVSSLPLSDMCPLERFPYWSELHHPFYLANLSAENHFFHILLPLPSKCAQEVSQWLRMNIIIRVRQIWFWMLDTIFSIGVTLENT